MKKKIRAVGAAILVVIWVALAGFAWFSPPKESSDAERRLLAQLPEISLKAFFNDDKFTTKFEDYTLDQFPARDWFRQLKSLTHYYAFQQKDNNGIYIEDGYAAKVDYPLNEEAVSHAMDRLNFVYDTYLKDSGSKVVMSVIPDKGYYLAEKNGYPAMDYEKLFKTVKDRMPWATHVRITDRLSIEDYYYTDTHWRQEELLSVAQRLSVALGVTFPRSEWYTKTAIDTPFYGVYHGQAALPMDPDQMYIMESDLLSQCTVETYDNMGRRVKTAVYDMEKLSGKDPYDVFLSGPQSIVKITNPNAYSKKELVIFRDSFGSSIAPLLVQDYQTVTLVDIRYIDSRTIGNLIKFNGQDVLMLYSTLVLNSGTTLK